MAIFPTAGTDIDSPHAYIDEGHSSAESRNDHGQGHHIGAACLPGRLRRHRSFRQRSKCTTELAAGLANDGSCHVRAIRRRLCGLHGRLQLCQNHRSRHDFMPGRVHSGRTWRTTRLPETTGVRSHAGSASLLLVCVVHGPVRRHADGVPLKDLTLQIQPSIGRIITSSNFPRRSTRTRTSRAARSAVSSRCS